jgi:hypothetical protein
MKQFLIEWCINLSIVILVVIYVGNFFLGCYLLDVLDDGAIYLSLWVIFYAVTTVTYYTVFFRKK